MYGPPPSGNYIQTSMRFSGNDKSIIPWLTHCSGQPYENMPKRACSIHTYSVAGKDSADAYVELLSTLAAQDLSGSRIGCDIFKNNTFFDLRMRRLTHDSVLISDLFFAIPNTGLAFLAFRRESLPPLLTRIQLPAISRLLHNSSCTAD